MSSYKGFEEGNYLVLSKFKIWMALVISLIVLGTTAFSWIKIGININDRTFDSLEQKYRYLNTMQDLQNRTKKLEMDAIETSKRQIIFGQVQLQILETQKTSKQENKENFLKVGQDLEQIKNQTRR